MTFGHFGSSRQPLWPILRILGIVVILGAFWPRNTNCFWGILGAGNPLFECCVFGVFLSARFS